MKEKSDFVYLPHISKLEYTDGMLDDIIFMFDTKFDVNLDTILEKIKILLASQKVISTMGTFLKFEWLLIKDRFAYMT